MVITDLNLMNEDTLEVMYLGTKKNPIALVVMKGYGKYGFNPQSVFFKYHLVKIKKIFKGEVLNFFCFIIKLNSHSNIIN
jgi:hypothetical protein